MTDKVFKAILDREIRAVEALITIAEVRGQTNEQYFIEFENEINRLSILDHNKHLNDNKN